MNFKFSKMISVVCVLAMLLSCFSSITMYADAAVEIITAEYDVYDGELRVLAKIPSGGVSEAVVSVCGNSVGAAEADWSEQGEYMLFKKAYTPAAYGICNVSVACGTVSDSVNVRFMKNFGKAESLEENFDTLAETTMDTVESTAVVDAFTTAGITDVTFTSIPKNSKNVKMHIKKGYAEKETTDSAIVFEVPKSTTGGLPNIIFTPATAPVGGVVELSFDTYVTNYYGRIGMLAKATNDKDMKYTSDIYETSWSSTYYALNHQKVKYGASDRQVVADKWTNIRFIHNFDEMTYEFYVDNELLDKGTFVYNSSTSTAVCGLSNIALTIGYGGGADSSADVVIDNVKILHTTTGAIPSAVSYNAQGSEEATAVSLTDAEIPYPVATDMTVNLSRTIGYSEGDIAVKTAAGVDTGATVSVTDDGTRSALAVDTSSLTPGEYKIVLSENVTFNSAAYGAPTEIPFTVVPTLTLISPASDMSVKKGDKALIKACTPGAGKVSIYVDDALLVSQAPDSVTKLVSAECDTIDLTLGTHEATLVLEKADGSVEYLRSSFVVNEVKEVDITPLDKFDSFDSADLTNSALDGITAQNKTTLRSEKVVYDTVQGNVAKIYYTEAESSSETLKGKKVLYIQDTFDVVNDGRIVLEHDLYVEDKNCTLNYELMGQVDSTKYTFYPLQTSTLFTSGKIGGVSIDGGYANAWHRVKIVIDFIAGQSEVYFDDEFIKSGALYTSTSGTTAVPAYQQIRINYLPSVEPTAGVETFGMAVDNWRVYKELPVPAVDSIAAGGAAAEENGVISSTDTFAVTLAGKYTYSALDSTNVSLLVNGVASEGTEVSYDKTTNVLTVTAANAVAAHSDVSIVISGDALLYDGATAAGADTAVNLKVADSNGLYAKRTISKVDTNMVLSAKLDAASERSVTLIFATYNGNRLVNIDTENVLVDGAKNISLTLPAARAGEARAFIWDGFAALIPQTGVTGPVAAN